MGLSAVPSEVWEAGDLVKVSLSKNSIQELPSQLSLCASLKVIRFSSPLLQIFLYLTVENYGEQLAFFVSCPGSTGLASSSFHPFNFQPLL